MTNHPFFRPEALRQLAATGDTDRLPTLVGSRRWLALVATAGLCLAAVAWSVWGRVPENVEGAGMFLHPGAVRPVQTTAAGQVVELRVRPNDVVSKGQVIAVLSQPELRQQLTQSQARLAELRRFDALQQELDRQRRTQEAELAAGRKAALGATIAELTSLASEMKGREKQLSETQRQRIDSMCETTRSLIAVLKRQQATVEELAQRKLATQEQVAQAETAVTNAALQLAGLEKQLAEIDLQEFTSRKERVERDVRIAELQLEARQVDLKLTQSQQDIERQQAERTLQVQLEQDKSQALESQLVEQEQVRSHEAGRLLEISVQPGQVVPAGMRIGLLAADETKAVDEPLRVVAYLPLASAKRIVTGMQALVTPTPIERDRHGSIVGVVRRVSAFPTSQEAAATAIGSSEVVGAMPSRGGVLEVEIELAAAETPSGFRWTSTGPDQRFTAGTTARVRVTVEERTPASFLAPWFRKLMFGPERELQSEARE